MIDGLEPYSAYKDSGVPWLGEVPEHWEVRQLGRFGTLSKGNGGNKEDEIAEGVPCIRYGDLYTQHGFFIERSRACVSPERASDYTAIRYGDVLFAASGETIEEIGKSAVNLMTTPAVCGGDVLRFTPAIPVNPRFMGYACDGPQAAVQKSLMGRGFTVMHIYGTQLKSLWVPLPPLAEQNAIARFLDHADRRIRRYIRAKQKLIELLEEQRQAIIHRAVTRSLDANVRFKPSGVDWLGDMPEHWQLRKLGHLARVFNGTTPSRMQPSYWHGGTVPWLSSGKVNDRIVLSPAELITERALRECSLTLAPKGSVIIGLVGQGRTRAMSAMLGIDACINQNLAAIVPTQSLVGAFLLSWLTAHYRAIRETARGGNQEALNTFMVSNLRIPVPCVDEQMEIAEEIAKSVQTVDHVRAAALAAIARLQEYRTRLIADVVTGKLDVREAATLLPDEPEETDALDEAETPVDWEEADSDAAEDKPEEAEA